MKSIRQLYQTRPLLCLFSIFILGPFFFAIWLGYSYLDETLPLLEGDISVEHISSNTSIKRDKNGVTYINAKTDNDVFFAMGFSHAQDRLWQLELQKRMSQGRLSEIFGKSAVKLDIYIRTLGIYQNAESSWNALSPEAQESLNYYALGINEFIRQQKPLPIEFTLLGIEPDSWKPTDSLAWIKMFSLNLAANYQKELSNLLVTKTLDEKKTAAILGSSILESAQTLSSVEIKALLASSELFEQNKLFEKKWQLGGQYIGSNAWVVSGEHTEDGNAILLNDPHLAMELPSMWYAVNLDGDQLKSSGMSLVGIPVVMLGKNQHIGWGATNMVADVQDLYYEQINTENTNQYKRGDKWVDFIIRNEVINVKADFPAFLRSKLAPLEIQVRETDHGPIISDLTGVSEQPLSLRWVGNSKNDVSYESFLKLNYASDWNSFKDAMKDYIAPALNFLYVDNKQNIGYLGVGKIPVRGKGIGNHPIPAWQEDFAWQGFIPYNKMPQALNPERGYFVSANNEVADKSYPYFISEDWADPARAMRIEELIKSSIDSGKKISLKQHELMQQEFIDKRAVEVLNNILSFDSDDELVKEMVEYLKNWNGSTDKESVAATIYFTWMRHLKSYLFKDDLKGKWGNANLSRHLRMIVGNLPVTKIEQALKQTDIDWCDRLDTDEQETCDDIKEDSLLSAHYELSKRLGSDISDWNWGSIHSAKYKHKPFSSVKGLDFIFERKIARGGSPDSINVSGFYYDIDHGYIQTSGPGFRQAIAFPKQEDLYLFMNSTGQSGNVFSEHYDDMIEPFLNGEYRSISANNTNFIHSLQLTPKAAVN
ncbi:penicillin acylase family protein [Aliikangiella sp. IMCC44359]|uniref:penicillin acylase family protein n=1 Tax=Aliikangiella sp. IMCC44359 TaxID=3459125 RepID=UPI00403B1514